jgi:hypothetical protein
MQRRPLKGQRFGRLLVLDDLERVPVGNPALGRMVRQVLVQCACGNQSIIWRSSLANENTRSCGCLRAESTTHENKRRARQREKQQRG